MHMKSEELIDRLGGTTAVAKLLDIKPPSVSAWRSTEIPTDKLIRLATIAEVRGIATRKSLLPDLWQQIWPELADEKAA